MFILIICGGSSGLQEPKNWKVYNCIIFEQTEDQTLYILTNGNWFEVDNDFVKEVDQLV